MKRSLSVAALVLAFTSSAMADAGSALYCKGLSYDLKIESVFEAAPASYVAVSSSIKVSNTIDNGGMELVSYRGSRELEIFRSSKDFLKKQSTGRMRHSLNDGITSSDTDAARAKATFDGTFAFLDGKKKSLTVTKIVSGRETLIGEFINCSKKAPVAPKPYGRD